MMCRSNNYGRRMVPTAARHLQLNPERFLMRKLRQLTAIVMLACVLTVAARADGIITTGGDKTTPPPPPPPATQSAAEYQPSEADEGEQSDITAAAVSAALDIIRGMLSVF